METVVQQKNKKKLALEVLILTEKSKLIWKCRLLNVNSVYGTIKKMSKTKGRNWLKGEGEEGLYNKKNKNMFLMQIIWWNKLAHLKKDSSYHNPRS